MSDAYIDWGQSPVLWLGTFLLALFGAYVTLGMARGVRSPDSGTSRRCLAGATVALAASVCGAHFIVLADFEIPVRPYHRVESVLGLVVVSLAVAALAIRLAVTRQPRWGTDLAAAVLLGLLLCAVPVLGMLSLDLFPAPVWLPTPWWGAWLVVIGAVAGAWALLSRSRHRRSGPFGLWQAAASLVLANGVLAGNGLLMQVMALPWEAGSDPRGATVGGDTLFALASLGVPALLSVLLLSSWLEVRFKLALRRAREEAEIAARTDPLTGLANRAMFETWLSRATAHADRNGERLAVLLVNIDGLKTVNESFGQAAGDAVLCEMGRRLRARAGGREEVARAGGDEFLVLLRGSPGTAEARERGHRLLQLLAEGFTLDERELAMSCSVGVAVFPDHGSHGRLITHAAAAMHAAKRQGGGAVSVFDPSMVAGARDQAELLRDLRHAVADRDLMLYYQPKVHAPSGQITGVEALMRWRHPQRGMVGPDVFVPLAERFGLIQPLGNWALDEVCRQIRAWADGGLLMRVALNLSVHQLRQEGLVERILDALARHDVRPGQLTCEITETVAMEDTRKTLRIIERLTAAGVHLSIDDFGTGYSSLSYLRQLAAEELKIDRSFVMDLEVSADARAIVDAVIKLAQALGMKVVAEGVETEGQQAILRGLGCDELQGYLFAKPMPAEALTVWAMRHEGPRDMEFRPSLFDNSLR
ncbi:putative bifunctional diguanylate cyclase/phosphodiesterase [Rhizobacter sp. LjRoot28]|uniref:putative bifunctional diguanylate cyclase/phosphodiesterase n=1 Tax=Rhizobacter sp. LjRoot28 TaxID=3342309 RepID=UPI003F501839